MSGKASKDKGKRFERTIAKILSDRFDTKVSRIPCSGALPGWVGDLRDLGNGPLKDFVWECKHQERINIWACLHQSQAEATGGRIPVLVFTKNHELNYVALELTDFLNILKELEDLKCGM